MNKSWNSDLVGILADEDYVLNTIDKQAIYINSQNVIQFFVKIISEEPESFPNVKLVTCYATDLERWGFEDNYNDLQHFRIRALQDFLQDNLVVFKPIRKVLFDHTEVFVGREIRLIPKAESFQDDVSLIPLPIFSEDEHGSSYSEFVYRLQNRKYIGRVDNISNEPNDTPKYILWKNNNEEYRVFGEFSGHHYAHGGFALSVHEPLKSIAFKDEWIDDCYDYGESIMFITFDILSAISELVAVGEDLDEDVPEIKPDEAHIASQEVAAAIAVEPPKSKDTVKEAIPQQQTQEQERKTEPMPLTEVEISEERLMDEFTHITREQGLLYDQADLYNFHTAMKSSNLVILAGMSGTGKSKLVQAYAKALGLFDSHQMTFIPVRPAWTDDADLIGYADTLHMVYRPGDSGLINTLMSAKENKKKLHIICFDEMNLARVEHYFSQFLSVLENESGPRRVLRLYNEDLENRLYNSAQYPPIIPIGENVIFVGTVNLDESTYHFSDKVLDRANVISLNVLPFKNLRLLSEEMKNAAEEKRWPLKKEKESITFEMYESFRNNDREIQLSNNELELLWEIHQELQSVNKNIGAGPRIVRQIDMYLKNLPNSEILSRQDAVDLQIVQRIMTKVRGPEEQLKKFLGTYDSINGTVIDSSLADILDKFHEVSEFYNTRNMIIHKAKELKINGYTL
ncbi:McrB family protein [Peribacillus kribbensis]|uniref:McrB family protein n=1 Tax=Peribacillus kribbensis TaxID=356658 RepID=UPI00041D51E3|nr:AAA family ATPase [Peribacillus kribbensis]